MFMGQFEHSLDSKGRLIVPAKLREELGDTFVITKGMDKCLYGYTNEGWQEVADKIAALPTVTNKAAREFARYFMAGATTCELDKQGRILIPQVLREFAGLDKDAILLGVGGRIEIWNKDAWLNTTDNYDSNIEDVVAKMSEFGFSL